jgi:hypothetical protein
MEGSTEGRVELCLSPEGRVDCPRRGRRRGCLSPEGPEGLSPWTR